MLVEQLSAFGIRQEDMCVMIEGANGRPITAKTLRKYFERELAEGAVKANVKAAQALFKQVERGSVAAIIFWLKTRGGWKESPQSVELTGAEGGPIENRTTLVNEKTVRAAVRKLESEY
jgi:hypothetical protein